MVKRDSRGPPGSDHPSRWPAHGTETGGVHIKLIITLIILAAAAYVAFQAVPVYMHNYELSDYANSLALDVVSNRIKADEVPADVVQRSGELNLPVELGDVSVDAEETVVRIHVAYTVLVNLKVYTWPMHFSISASAPRLAY
jgi:hypothetical protein